MCVCQFANVATPWKHGATYFKLDIADINKLPTGTRVTEEKSPFLDYNELKLHEHARMPKDQFQKTKPKWSTDLKERTNF